MKKPAPYKINRCICALALSVFYITVFNARQADATSLFSFLGDLSNAPPAMREYQNEKLIMSTNPFYDFDEGSYADAPALEEDTRMQEACFKGAAEQNIGAGNDLRAQSTLSTEMDTIQGIQPTECMPHKTTRRFSPLELNPWYLTSILSDQGIREYYQPTAEDNIKVNRGGRNPIMHRLRMVAPTQTMELGCAEELMVGNLSGSSDLDNPNWMRRELDNCTNQYILQQSRFLRDPDDPGGEYFGVNAGLCQPLRLELPPTRHELYEYAPSEYVGVAWVKLLMDHTYQYRNGLALSEPHYARDTRVRVTRQIPIPADRFGLILVEDLAEEDPVDLQFEKILDPSHPFSPRWDFEINDRSFSPTTVIYSQNPQDSVRCSDEVPVDLLNFRKHIFDRWIPHKVAWNIACYLDRSPFGCYNIIWLKLLQCTGSEPCCSTRYDVADKWEEKFGETLARAICGVPMREICNYVGRPLTGVNTLKMREDNEENFPYGVPEGYKFSEYFGDHKPYMRCWDSNTECGGDSQTYPENVQGAGQYDFVYDVNSTTGSEYALMGAGREGESCLIGGGLGEAGVANPDPISSWSELKLYYVRSMRTGAKCIGNHEKMFKAGNAEDMLLTMAGARWQKVVPDTKGNQSRYRTINWPLGWRGWVSDPDSSKRFPNFGGGGSVRTGLDQAVKGEVLIFDEDVVMAGAPGTWRNPYLAVVKDVVNVRYREAITNPAIAATHNPAQDNIKVSAFNHGKYIDACGNSDQLGLGPDFAIYKTQTLSPGYTDKLDSLENVVPNYSCDDPGLSSCYEPYWNDVKRYFIKENIR